MVSVESVTFLASCRADFDSSIFSGKLRYRPVPWDTKRLAGARVLVLVHGYRNSFHEALRGYETIWTKVKEHKLPYDECVGFFWPGGALAAGFLQDVRNAENSAGELLALLNFLYWQGATVDIQTHSLGARVALQCVQYAVKVRNLILSAPAVDFDCLNAGAEFDRTTLNAQRIIVAHSKEDGVLGTAYRASKFWFGKRALGYTGPSLVGTALSVNLDQYVNDHSGYRDCDEYYRQWHEIMVT